MLNIKGEGLRKGHLGACNDNFMVEQWHLLIAWFCSNLCRYSSYLKDHNALEGRRGFLMNIFMLNDLPKNPERLRQRKSSPLTDRATYLHSQTWTRRGKKENEWKKRRALTSIDISISRTQHYQSIWLHPPPPHPVPCVSQAKQLLRWVPSGHVCSGSLESCRLKQ